MGDYRKLDVWMRAHALVLAVYRVSAEFPDAERFGLQAQVRRSASSIAANIAEGCGRRGDGSLLYSLRVARGSAWETQYHLRLAHDLEMLPAEVWAQLSSEIDTISVMLVRLMAALRKRGAEKRRGR